jgi:hypothetical protein
MLWVDAATTTREGTTFINELGAGGGVSSSASCARESDGRPWPTIPDALYGAPPGVTHADYA